MLNGKQIGVIGLVVVMMGLLLSLDIKGLNKEGEGQHAGEAAKKAIGATQVNLTVERVSQPAKETLNAGLSAEITALEENLNSAPEAEKQKLLTELAQKWDDLNQPGPSAFYYQQIAEKGNTLKDWLKAGDQFTEAYQRSQDSIIQPALVQKALSAYQSALKLDSKNLAARTGSGVAYVNGAGSPMQGIQLLLGVVKEDPKNVNANLNLGLFSMKSGQFDKAVTRFKTVIEQRSTPEVWFYMASSLESLGKKADAIDAYIKAKELAGEPALSKFVDNKIQELSK